MSKPLFYCAPAFACLIGVTLFFRAGEKVKGKVLIPLADNAGSFGFIVEQGGQRFLAIGSPPVYIPYNGEHIGCYPDGAPALKALGLAGPAIVVFGGPGEVRRVWRVSDGAELWRHDDPSCCGCASHRP